MNLTMLRHRALPTSHDTAADPVPAPPSVEVGARPLRIGDDRSVPLYSFSTAQSIRDAVFAHIIVTHYVLN